MSWKKIIATTSSILYLILSVLLVYYYRLDFICGYGKPCLRFCSTDTEKYSDRTLYDSIKKDNLTEYYDPEFADLNIYRGPPSCNGKLTNVKDLKDESDRNYSSHVHLYDDGNVYNRGHDYSPNKNCFKFEDESEKQEWTPMVCTNETMQYPAISWIMTILSVTVLALTIIIYSYFSELHDFHGKMIILFLSSVICTYLVIPGIVQERENVHKLMNLLMGYGFTSGHLWLNSMILNIYFRCRDFQTLNPKDDKFKSFAIYVSIFTTFVIVFIMFDMLLFSNDFSVELISIINSYLLLNDIIVLIITSIIIRKISKQIDFSERSQLEKEKKLFWIYVKLFAIMSVTWSTQIFALKSEFNSFGCLTSTFIMLFSAINLSGLFIGRRKVRNLLFEIYNRTFDARTETDY